MDDYKKTCTISDSEILQKTLSIIPSYKFFSILYENAAVNHYQLNLQLELVNAYTLGYTSCGCCNYNSIFELYTYLNNKLKEYEASNIEEIQKEKKKTLNNK